MTNKLLPEFPAIMQYLDMKAYSIAEDISNIAYDMVEDDKYQCTLLISDTLDDDTHDMMRANLAVEIEEILREKLKNLLLK